VRILSLRSALSICALLPLLASAQQGPPRPPEPPANARVAAPRDVTGQWVSVVTEDWRWRMITPPKGDVSSVPLTPAARDATRNWDLAADNAAGNQCRAFGAAAIMRVPTRIRIDWQDDNTLELETDAGQQTRLFKFLAAAPSTQLPALTTPVPLSGERSWQGDSKAQWFRQPQSRTFGGGGAAASTAGSLRVFTQNLKAGYLRGNGVPYSEDARVMEQFDRHDEPNGDQWLTVTTIVEDPINLVVPFITSASFRKEADRGKWNPTPCNTPAPLQAPLPPPRPRP
jgi:hypothetical protein